MTVVDHITEASIRRRFEEKQRQGAQEERLRWLADNGFVPMLLAFIKRIEVGSVDIRPLLPRDAAPVVARIRSWVEERIGKDLDLVDRPLNDLWSRINALGGLRGCGGCGKCFDCGYAAALDHALAKIEELGGEDPAVVTARERRLS